MSIHGKNRLQQIMIKELSSYVYTEPKEYLHLTAGNKSECLTMQINAFANKCYGIK